MTLYFGKLPHAHDPRDLLLTRYTAELPPLPDGPLGHPDLIPADGWGMLGNDAAGDCVWAGGDHEHMLWNAEAGRTVTFSQDTAFADYSAVTSYNPADPSTDRGTNMRDAMLYRQQTGLIDTTGQRHRIAAFTALGAGNLIQIKQSLHLVSVAAVGIQVPSTAIDQFHAGQPWSVVAGASIEGGHYVPIVGYDPATNLYKGVTWGRIQLIEAAFLATYMDEGFAPLTDEMLAGGKSLEGLDLASLLADLADLAAAS
jgi:hypothetical protein